MARVGTYLNFARNTEEAFNFYKSVFGTEFEGKINRMAEVSPQENPLQRRSFGWWPQDDREMVLFISLVSLRGVEVGFEAAYDEFYGKKTIRS